MDPITAREHLSRIWKNLDGVGDPAVKFQWAYETAPNPPDTVFLLSTEGQVVGSAGYAIRTLRVAGEPWRVAVIADLAVDPAHRSLSPALSLVKSVRDFARDHFDFAYGWPNQKAEGVFARAGYKPLGRMYRYCRVTRYEAYVNRLSKYTARIAEKTHLPEPAVALVTKRPVALVATRVLTLGSRVLRFAERKRLEGIYTLHWSSLADPRLDEIWHLAQSEYPIAAARTAEFLTWRFVNEPVRVAILSERAGAKPCAYAIVRHVDGDAQIVDLFGVKSRLSPLLEMLFAVLSANETTHVVSCLYLGQPDVSDMLLAHGFERQDAKGRAVYMYPGKIPESFVRQLENPNNWHFTALDEDV